MRQFDTEQDAVYEIAGRMHEVFRLLSEVQMRHLDGTRLRMDLLAIPRKEAPEGFHRFSLIGVEVKPGYDNLRDFNRALKQAIDYRHSILADHRVKRHHEQTPPFVFIYPDFHDNPDDPAVSPIYRGGYYGSVRLAGQFNVGVIREVYNYWGHGKKELEFRVSDTPIWRSHTGWVNGVAFGTARRRGAA